MCGIVGTNRPGECPPEAFDRMVDALAHRGPDDRGVYRGGAAAIGHRRLSILDPTSRGHQPMSAARGAIHIVYNGEIYNHQRLRRLLPGAQWESSCDTETILRLYEKQGPSFVEWLNGMFAMAIHDERIQKLFLFRDRLGEKPLYYFQESGRFAFASELKALLPHPRFSPQIRPRAVSEYFLFNYIPDPLAIYKGVRKLPPGNMLEFDLETERAHIEPYWTVKDCFFPGMPSATTARSIGEAEEELESLLSDSVRMRTLSDVPLGCFLSGGVDSSLIASELARHTSEARTFTISFADEEYDEGPRARETARLLETQHQQHRVEARDLLDLIEDLPQICDEPFADASIIPTAILARWTRQHVTVALSGDGGDELFLGYDRYRWARDVSRTAAWLPSPLRRAMASLAERIPNYRLQTIARGMQFASRRQLYPFVFAGWNAPFVKNLLSEPLLNDFNRHPIHDLANAPMRLPLIQRAALTDLQHYLPADILVKMDRAAMASSLETRPPLLDHRIVEFALRLPARFKMRGGEQKILLKRLLRKRLPAKIVDGPKRGFAVPLKHWFRGELKTLITDHLAPDALRHHGFFDEHAVQSLLARHFSGQYNHERQIWALLMFQLWYRKYVL